MASIRKTDLTKRSPGAFETYRATATSAISAGEIVRVTGTSDGGAYYLVQKAQTGQAGKLMVATIDSSADVNGTHHLLVATSDVLTLDTSAASLGDTVYLSAGTPGAMTLTATTEAVGLVTAVSTTGAVELNFNGVEGLAEIVDGSSLIPAGGGDYYIDIPAGTGLPVTIGAPTAPGQHLSLSVQSDALGTWEGQTAVRFNATGNTSITFTATHQSVVLYAVANDTSGIRWQLINNDGATLA